MKRKMILLFIIVITFVMVKDVYAEKFNGEYSIDYLLRNYSAVTFNNKKYNIPSSVYYTLNNYSEGSVYNLHNAEGAVLISGNYISDSPAQFDTAGGNVKSYIGGGVQNVQSANEFNFVTEPEYVDFDKLYINVVNESQKLAESSEYNINDSKVEISKPGIYSVNNTALFYSNHSANPIENNKTRFYNNRILINNYDRNSYYVFNYYDEYIESLPEGYNTIVGEGGVNLSGGQRQRLAIARAFIRKTEIILFDEATSALDNETQEHIQNAINNLQKDKTILIIAHRLSTVINADRIMVVDGGKIVGEGTHKELLKSNKLYKELYTTELQKENK